MFCKLCFDACRIGYDQHNIRDSSGNTVCPYLLSIKCLECGVFGHTVKYCKNGSNSNSNSTVEFKPKRKVEFEASVKKSYDSGAGYKLALLNKFSMLGFDDCSECDDNDDGFLMGDVIWGQGLKSMIGLSWADECGY